MVDFALYKRKTSAYTTQNKLYSATNRKISAYISSAGYFKDRTPYLNEGEMNGFQKSTIHIKASTNHFSTFTVFYPND
jgi:hypothetical protein